MDSPHPLQPNHPSRAFRRWRMISWTVLAVACGLYGWLIAHHVGAWAGGSDSSGYLNNARLIRAGKIHETRRHIEGLPVEKLPSYAYVPLGFLPIGQQEMIPTYPIGLSLLMVAVSPVTGWPLAPPVTMWLHAMAGVGLMFGLARAMGLSLRAALFGALLLAVSPLYLFMSLQAMSDGPALVWCTAAVLSAWLSRKKDLWALAAGVCVAVAVLVRPSNLLIVAPIALCLGLRWQRWFWLALGGAPGAVFLALFNLALYGDALKTGYGAVGEIFRLGYVPASLANYAQWLPVVLTPGVFLLLALPWIGRREPRLLLAILGLWMATFVAFYAFYYHTHETWWYLRFILPAFPAMIIGMLLAHRAIIARWAPRQAAIVSRGAVLAVLAWGAYWGSDLWALESGRGEKIYPDSARWARAHLPPNAVLLTMQVSGALLYYTNFTFLRYDHVDPSQFAMVERYCQEKGRPLYAILFPEEKKRVFEIVAPGGWTQVGAVQHVTIWQRTPGSSTATVPWHVLTAARLGETDIIARGVEGWFTSEHSQRHKWTWSRERSTLELETWPQETRRLQFKFGLRTLAPSVVTIKQGDTTLLRREIGRDRIPIDLTVQVTQGRARLEFSSDSPGVLESSNPDARLLAFAIYDPRLKLPEGKW